MGKAFNPWKLSGYKAGQNVVCKILRAEPGGYAVIVPKDNLPGFLPTQTFFRPGEELLVQFICVHNNRILFSDRFGSNSGAKIPPPRWQTDLNQLNALFESDSTAGKPSQAVASVQANDPAANVATDKTEAEAAFDLWAESRPPQAQLRRATDLILPPLTTESVNSFAVADYDLEWLITDLEGGMRTGCLKASSESKLSRSAMLFYKGRVVGCIYGCKSMPDKQLTTEEAMQATLGDLKAKDALVKIYDLPENIILPMSSLFLGYPVQGNNGADATSYTEYLTNWFAGKQQTACLAVNIPTKVSTCLGFYYNGQFVGAFSVEEQKLVKDRKFLYELLRQNADANVEASILPPEMISSAVRFGFSLSMSRQPRQSS